MKKVLRNIILVVSIAVFVYSAFNLAKIWYDYRQIDKLDDSIVEEYSTEEIDPLERKIDFDALLKRNSDVIGWLYIPETSIDEPILKGANNDTYLRTDIDKNSNIAGTLFIDERNNKDFKDKNTIIYGHNMKNSSRFHDLRHFVKDDYFAEHKEIYIYLPDGQIYVYDIISANEIHAESSLYSINNSNEFIADIFASSLQKREVSEYGKPLVMLSTCYASGSDQRYVVFGQLREEVKPE